MAWGCAHPAQPAAMEQVGYELVDPEELHAGVGEVLDLDKGAAAAPTAPGLHTP